MRPARLSLVMLLACCTIDAQEPRIQAIVGVTLIDGTTRQPVQDAVIVIDSFSINRGVRMKRHPPLHCTAQQ